MSGILSRVSGPTRLFAAIAAVVVVLDQWTKYLAVAFLTKAFQTVEGEPLSFFERVWRFLSYRKPPRDGMVAVLDDFWHFRYVENPGAAWGFLSQSAPAFRTPFFLLVSLAAMAFIVYYFRKTGAGQGWLRIALALVFGGAVGNFIDRVRLGYVIDFIDWHWYDQATWPTFNVADSAISVGVVMLLLDMKIGKQARDELEKAAQGEKAAG